MGHEDDRAWFAPITCERHVSPEQAPLTLQMRHFCDVVRGVQEPLVSGRDAVRTLQALLAI